MSRGATIKAIQSAMGHAHAETTFTYLNMGEQEARSMSDLGALVTPKDVSKPPSRATEPKCQNAEFDPPARRPRW